MRGFYFLKSRLAKAVHDSGIDFRLCSTSALQKKQTKKALYRWCSRFVYL